MCLNRLLPLCALLFSQMLVAADLPQRWVSAGGSLSEWVVALGGEARLVGVDSTSQHPASLRALPNIGYQRALSAEGILALHPDILVGSEEMGPPPVLRQLQAAGIRVESLPASADLAVLEDNLDRLGEWLDARARAGALMHNYRQRLERQASWVSAAQQQQAPPRVLMLLGHAGNNLLAAGEGSLAAWMIEQAGGLNLPTHDGYKPLSSEAILALDPQVLIFADRSLQGSDALEALLRQNPALRQTPAGRDQRLLNLDPTLLVGGLGPRIPETLAELSAALYPSATALADESDR